MNPITVTYYDKYTKEWKVELYKGFLHSYKSYIIIPEKHWLLEIDGLSNELLKDCYQISGDELVFISSNKAGYCLNKSIGECLDIMIKTITLLEQEAY